MPGAGCANCSCEDRRPQYQAGLSGAHWLFTACPRMIDLAAGVRALHHRVRLGFRSDLKWWDCLLPACVEWYMPNVKCGEEGPTGGANFPCVRCLGPIPSTGLWFQLKFPDSWSELHITVKELLPIVLAVAMWGYLWTGMTVLCRCDNMAVVAIINLGRSRMDKAMHLMRCLSFFLARWDVALVCKHIPGTDTGAADALSRNSLPLFQQLVPESAEDATSIPEGLLQCLVHDPGLDQSGLGDPVQKFYMMGLVESTHKLYACGVRRFIGICSAAGRIPVLQTRVLYAILLLRWPRRVFVIGLPLSPIWQAFVTSTFQRAREIHFQQGCTDCTMSCGG